MKKTTKILVPVDFSPCSKNALTFAIQLADKINGELLVLNIPTFGTAVGENPVSLTRKIQERVSQSEVQMKNFITEAQESVRTPLNKKPMIQTNIELGKIENIICSEAATNEIDYIIMGTQGEKSTLEKFLGSVASGIVKNAPCSVMVIPEYAEFEEEIDLCYATDLANTDIAEIWKAIKLFSPFQPDIKCVHFNEKQANNANKIKALASYFTETAPDLDIELYSLPVKDKVEDMNDFIKKEGVNMLVMYKPKRSFFESLFHRSYTQTMAKHIQIPLLVLKEKND